MRVTTVSFFGHRILYDTHRLRQSVEAVVMDLLEHEEYVVFYVGRGGDFDQIVSSTIRRCKREVRCYRNEKEALREYYDDIILSGCGAYAYPKGAHAARNREVIEMSDLVVCCVREDRGGAYQAMEYAQKLGKRCINLLE